MKGSYVLVILINKDVNISIGSLGKVQFKEGFYFYVGSAMGKSGSATLINRVKRHILPPEKKKVHWHIDYLLADKDSSIVRLYLLPSRERLECIIAQELFEISENYIRDFGSSDCDCKSHLFYFKKLPECL